MPIVSSCPICGDPTHPEGRCPLNPEIAPLNNPDGTPNFLSEHERMLYELTTTGKTSFKSGGIVGTIDYTRAGTSNGE